MNFLETIIIAIIEGLTEFLPVSSTGHMIVAESLLGVDSTPFVKAFTVMIQLGAILSVVIYYWRRFFDFSDKKSLAAHWGLSGWNLYLLMFVGCIPAAVVGGFLNDYIDSLLSSTWIVVLMLFLGGLVMIWMDRRYIRSSERPIHPKNALMIGLYQCLAMVPGVSRSMATILGGLNEGLSRRQAAEFSFFLAVPTMLGATLLKAYKLWKEPAHWQQLLDNVDLLIIGNVVAFLVAFAAIRFFIGYVSRYGFRAFGGYRIVISIVLAVLMLLNILPTSIG